MSANIPAAKFSKHIRPAAVAYWLQRHSPLWPGVLGVVLGLGIGVGALFGITGIAGMGLCLLVLSGATWWAKDAEPVLVGLDVEPEPQKVEPQADPEPEPKPVIEPPLPAIGGRLVLEDTDEPAPVPEPPLDEPLDMVELEGGTFLMDSPKSDDDALDDEKPQHEVTVSAFCISRYPITRQLYRDIVGPSPEAWDRDRDTDDQQLPANSINWFEAARFCNMLSAHVGLLPCYRIDGDNVEWDREADGYRLPTEAEWEYACRAGTTSKWFFGDEPTELGHYAWFSGNSENKVHPVGEKKPNAWDLYDMIGNVWEWCWDWYADYPNNSMPTLSDPTGPKDGSRRVLRGGSWNDNPRDLRSADRDWLYPVNRFDVIGFRCVRRPRRQH